MWERVRNWFDPSEVHEVGSQPDYRFSLANERTFLAWVRTGLALIGGGLAVAQFLSPLSIPHLGHALAIAMVTVGAGCALRAVDHWIRCAVAMRTGQPLPASRFPAVLAILVALGGVLVLIDVIVNAAR